MSVGEFDRTLAGTRGFAAIELSEIAAALGADVDYLVTGEESSSPVFTALHEPGSGTQLDRR